MNKFKPLTVADLEDLARKARVTRSPTAADLAAIAAQGRRIDAAVRAVSVHPYGLAARLVRLLVSRPAAAVANAGVEVEKRLYSAARRRLAARFPDLAGAPWW